MESVWSSPEFWNAVAASFNLFSIYFVINFNLERVSVLFDILSFDVDFKNFENFCQSLWRRS